MSKDEKCTCKACKNTVFHCQICKFVGFVLPSSSWLLNPGFHIVESVVSVVRKKFIGQLQFYGNLPYKCSIQKKRQIQLFVRDRMNSICPMNFFRTTDTTATTDTTIWKPGFSATRRTHCFCILNMETTVPFCRAISVRQLPFAVLSDNVF